MAYDRYNQNIRDRNRERSYGRERGYGSDRSRGSMFDFDRSRGRDGGNSFGGWAGDGRNSAYDRSHGQRSRFAERGRFGDDRREERRFGPDDYREGLNRDETSQLIASNKVEGTAVYGRNGNRLGSIYNFMVDKRSGRVAYAVMSYGGFLGMGTRYYPLPWKTLDYDTSLDGFHVDMDEEELEDAPSFDRETEPRFDDRYHAHVHSYYGLM